MKNGCICHFCGYEIKDAAARKAIQQETATREQENQQAAAAREELAYRVNNAEQLIDDNRNAITLETQARTAAIQQEAAAREELAQSIESINDYIVECWEDVDFTHFVRKYNNGIAEGIFQAKWNGLVFTQEHKGFYTLASGRVRVGLQEAMNGVLPEYCSVNVTKVTVYTDDGLETFGPPVMAMVCGTPEVIENYGVVSPRILLLSDEICVGANVELEVQCRWKWK